ncbi:hypothetical protein TNCV_2778321 [Trichonephila clavipes]|nr:hypothetical protein TNCV_2778321 [Trichonephila clavipes]
MLQEHFPTRRFQLSYHNPIDFFLCGHLNLFLHETLVAAVEHLMAQIVVASTGIASTLDLLERVHNSLSVSAGCAINYAVTTSNTHWDNQLPLHL